MMMMMMCKVKEVGHSAKLHEEYTQAMHAERLSQVDTDSDCPSLSSSSEPEDSDDEGTNEGVVEARKRVEEHFDRQSSVSAQLPLKWSTFELWESEDDTEEQVEGVPEPPSKHDTSAADMYGQNCASS